MGLILINDYRPGIIFSEADVEQHNQFLNEIDENLKKLNSKFFKPKDEILRLESLKQKVQADVDDFFERQKNIQKIKLATIIDVETKVAGVNYHQNNVKSALKSIIEENNFLEPYDGYKKSDFEESLEPVYKYSGYDTSNVTLEAEPDNEFDSNAIKVLIDDGLVGYLPKDIAAKMVNYVSDSRYDIKPRVEVVGGPYKEFDIIEDKLISKKDDFNFLINIKVVDKSKL